MVCLSGFRLSGFRDWSWNSWNYARAARFRTLVERIRNRSDFPWILVISDPCFIRVSSVANEFLELLGFSIEGCHVHYYHLSRCQ